jgi:hypothetical protein
MPLLAQDGDDDDDGDADADGVGALLMLSKSQVRAWKLLLNRVPTATPTFCLYSSPECILLIVLMSIACVSCRC